MYVSLGHIGQQAAGKRRGNELLDLAHRDPPNVWGSGHNQLFQGTDGGERKFHQEGSGRATLFGEKGRRIISC
jgi:hypothetical protein